MASQIGVARNGDTGIVPAVSDHIGGMTFDIYRVAGKSDTGCRFERGVRDNGLAGRYAAQHATGVIRFKTFGGDLVTELGAFGWHTAETVTDLHAFGGIDAHHGVRDVSVQPVEYRLAQTRRYALGNHSNLPPTELPSLRSASM